MPSYVPAPGFEAYLASHSLQLDPRGAPIDPIVFVDLDELGSAAKPNPERLEAWIQALAGTGLIVIGTSSRELGEPWRPLLEAMTCTLVAAKPRSRAEIQVPDLNAAGTALEAAVRHSPRAALCLRSVLAAGAGASAQSALVIESLAYSMLLAGGEFAAWRGGQPARAVPVHEEPAVLLDRHHEELHVTLNRPKRHNAYSRDLRDALVDAFNLLIVDPSIERMVLSGLGPSFCSGGDLDEFGSTPDVTSAHLIRMERSVADRMLSCHERVEVRLHGACIGAGIEIPAFAGHVLADPETFCQLPELTMGLIPGAGGTVGVTQRVGRWRTAYLALTGVRIDAATALGWGLVDAVAGR